jgi:transposase
MDLRKIKGLQIMKQDGIRKMHKGWAVRSQSANKYYFVDDAFNCSCPDCEAGRATFCKHAHAVRYYLRIEKPDGTNAKVRLTYKQAWHAYTEAQKSEVNQFDVLLKDLVQSINEPKYKFGRPALSKRELTFCAIQKVYSQLSSRRAYSLFQNAQGKELIQKTPNYNAINKFLNQKKITPILKELVGISATPLKAIETKFAVDSTGFSTTRFNEYCKYKHRIIKKHRFVKLHAACGVKTNVVCSAEVTQEYGGDSPQFEGLVKKVSGNGFNIEEVSADKAYSTKANLQLVDDLGGTAFIPFKDDATGRSKAPAPGRGI